MPWRSLAARAFRWWLMELYGLFPDSIITKFKNWMDRPLRLAFGAQEASLLVPGEAGLPQAVIPLELDGSPSAILARRHLQGARVEICVDKSFLLRCTVELPMSAESTLEPILRNRLALLVPLDPATLRSVWHMIDRKAGDNRLKVEVLIVKQATIDRAVAFSLAHGLVPRSVVIAGDDEKKAATIWLQTGTPRLIERERLYRRGLEAFSVLCAVLAYALLVWHLNTREAILRDLVSDSQTRAAAVSVGRQRTESVEHALIQSQERLATPSALAVLEELTKALPPDSSISEFHLQHGQVNIIGTASHATALLGQIEKTPLFENPIFEAPITAAPGGAGERFDLRFQIRGAGEP